MPPQIPPQTPPQVHRSIEHGTLQAISRDLLREKYAQPGEEGLDAVRQRIARALGEAEVRGQRAAWTARFLAAQREGFIPAGRIAANAGTGLDATMINCFVQPVGDSLRHAEGGHPPIYQALAEAAQTLRLGGGVGLDFSRIRPEGARVAGSRTGAAGPLAFIRLFDASCRALESSGARRGAHMGVLRCDHPDIERFTAAKAQGGLARFNLSVGVTDDFMQALEADGEIELVHAAEPGSAGPSGAPARRADGLWRWGRVPARRLWAGIVGGAHARGDPGLLFLDRINADNNLGDCETLAATNPCGEQPLPPYGGCCLGSIDLTRFVTSPFEADAAFEFDRFARLVPVAVRMLDNVLDLSRWPLPAQQREALGKRRVGLGFTGLGDALAMLGLHYGSTAARALAARVAERLRDAAYAASCALARERGSFPLFEAHRLLHEGRFASRLPSALRARIREDGLRHSHLLAIAPAGSISRAFADNVSSGIEPAWAWRQRLHRVADGHAPNGREVEVENHASRLFHRLRGEGAPLPPAFVSALELPLQAHLAMVAAVAPFVDGGISKTVNAAGDCSPAQVDALLRRAWHAGLKGLTVFRAACLKA